MRTSLTDIQHTEHYLQGGMESGDKLVFEARLLADPALSTNMSFQQRAYKLLRLFHRKRVIAEISAVQEHIFSSSEHTAFRQQIQSLFK